MDLFKVLLIMVVAVQVWVSTLAGVEIFNVLPDDSTTGSCPSQPCATLSQYLLDNNGTLPVVSNVEYHFLPGEHHLPTNMALIYLQNFTFFGVANKNSSPPKLVCCSSSLGYQLIIEQSNYVRVVNIIFMYCNTFSLQINLEYLLLYACFSCRLENVTFVEGGVDMHNALGNTVMKNLSIELKVHRAFTYYYGIYILYYDEYNYNSDHIVNSVEIIDTSIIGTGITVHVYQIKYPVKIVISNSLFQHNKQKVITIFTEVAMSTLIENCTFELNHYMHYQPTPDQPMIQFDVLSVVNTMTNVTFLNCNFYQNDGYYPLILVDISVDEQSICYDKTQVTANIILQGCKFTKNVSPILIVNGAMNSSCIFNVFIIGPCFVYGNTAGEMIVNAINVALKLDGPVTFSHNSAASIMLCRYCDITISNDITFTSNECSGPVVVTLFKTTYMKLMEYTNIVFTNNTYSDEVIILHHSGPHPYCGFQYISLHNRSTALITYYNITIINNVYSGASSDIHYLPVIKCPPSLHHYTTHCRWIPTSVFYGYNPGVINQQIIQTDQLTHHTTICYCSHNITNCSVDALGPVHPGQVLQVELCVPNSNEESILHVDTLNALLPASTCMIAHQTELLQTITGYATILNFTIVTEAQEMCELFLTASPCLNDIYETFYIEILPCPIGFKLQNGVCDCDPYLSKSNIHIDTCYIDQSTITRPANTWTATHNYSNSTKYLISHNCPMDYCLPHSSHLNLLHPDLQCQFNRTGILCSQCQHSLSMVFGSSRCTHCTNIHILITIIVILAGIVLVVLLYILNLTVTNGFINGIIFYANIISINDSVFLVNDNVFKPLRVFISFTNLDLGIETCFYEGMDGYAKMFLQLFFPLYLIVIAVSIIVASRYSSRILRWTYTRSLPVLAMLFLLSYTSVLRAVLTVLFSYSTITHLPSGHQQVVWSIDASVPLFGLRFTILFIICLVLFLLLIPFNIILLFTRYLLRFRLINHFKPLLDAFQGSYKDKYYYWIGLHIILRSLLFSFYAFQTKVRLLLTTMILILIVGFFGYTHPNKRKLVNIQELLLLLNLTMMYAVSYWGSGGIFSTVTNVMISLALIQFCTIVFYHFLTYTCHCKGVPGIQIFKEKIMNLCNKKNCGHHGHRNRNDLALLNIPERAYNYNEYRDGLVSDDFREE